MQRVNQKNRKWKEKEEKEGANWFTSYKPVVCDLYAENYKSASSSLEPSINKFWIILKNIDLLSIN